MKEKIKEKPIKSIKIHIDYGTHEGEEYVTIQELKEMLDSIDNCECKKSYDEKLDEAKKAIYRDFKAREISTDDKDLIEKIDSSQRGLSLGQSKAPSHYPHNCECKKESRKIDTSKTKSGVQKANICG